MNILKGRAALIIDERDFDVDQIVGISNIGLNDPARLAPFALEWCGQEFADRHAPGDFIIAAANFGFGHPHPQPMATMRHLGIAAVISESVCPYFAQGESFGGFATIECPGILAAVDRWDELEIDWGESLVKNHTRGTALEFAPPPQAELAALAAGDFIQYLKNRDVRSPGVEGVTS